MDFNFKSTKKRNIYTKKMELICLERLRVIWGRNWSKKSEKMLKKPTQQIKIAKIRINFLFRLAKEDFKNNSKLSDKYVKIARRIAMKYKIRLPSSLKKRFCKHCHKYLVPSVNCRIRIHKHRIIYYCLSCKHFMRHPVK